MTTVNPRWARRESAPVTYCKALMHAADGHLSVKTENWIPAAVSLYYSVFDLTIVALLGCNANPKVNYKGKRMTLDKAVMKGAQDVHELISHKEAIKFAKKFLPKEFADDLKSLKSLREYASYKPRIQIQDDGKTIVDICEFSPEEFVTMVQYYSQKIDESVHIIRNFLEDQISGDQEDIALGELVHLLIDSYSEYMLTELGKYRKKEILEFALELHNSTRLEQGQ